MGWKNKKYQKNMGPKVYRGKTGWENLSVTVNRIKVQLADILTKQFPGQVFLCFMGYMYMADIYAPTRKEYYDVIDCNHSILGNRHIMHWLIDRIRNWLADW